MRRLLLGLSLLGLGAASLIGAPAAYATDSNCPAAAGSYAGGTGTSGDPFLISTPAQLQHLRDTSADWNDAVRLTTDIDMGGCTWGSTLGNPNVASWTGTFDGDGHIVTGLDIDLGASAGGYAGFIALMGSGGTVMDFGFAGDVSLTTADMGNVSAWAGGLVGFTLSNTSIERCFFIGDVNINLTVTPGGLHMLIDATASATAGGLVGSLAGDIVNSFATGAVTVSSTATGAGSGYADAAAGGGGLVGDLVAGSVINSYTTVPITTHVTATGGSSQTTSRYVGGVIGVRSGLTTLTGVVWDTAASGESLSVGLGSSDGATGLTTAQMRKASTFGPSGQNWPISEGYSPATPWGICPEHAPGYPFLNALSIPSVCPPPPMPSSPPREVAAVAGDASAVVTWKAPTSPGSFPISHYQAVSSPGGHTCLVAAPAMSCSAEGLTNGTAYTFTVTTLTGVGWSMKSDPSNSVTPRAVPRPTIVIAGSREGPRIAVSGSTTGMGMGALIAPWTSRSLEGFVSRTAIPVSIDGTFTWSRRASSAVVWRVYFTAEAVRSNTVTIR
ncbi:MAG: hypothetical protein RL134_1059 [Actinomycetota bacterium]